jgi:hypothetical protein
MTTTFTVKSSVLQYSDLKMMSDIVCLITGNTVENTVKHTDVSERVCIDVFRNEDKSGIRSVAQFENTNLRVYGIDYADALQMVTSVVGRGNFTVARRKCK